MLCSKCGLDKPEDAFSVRNARPRGRNSHCKECVRGFNTTYYQKTAEKQKHASSEYRKANREFVLDYLAEYREKNREKLNRQIAEIYQRDPSKKHARTVKRRASKLKATPSWANHGYIGLFYQMAREESERLGVKVHVDHIVPLQSKLVCGLHNEFNLQLLAASANLKKSNRVWPNMP